MSESIRYLALALQTIKLLQTELIKQLQKSSSVMLLEFKKSFDQHLNKVKNVQMQKSIECDKISTCVIQLEEFLQNTIRMRKTSQSQRYNYKARLASRQFDRMQLTSGSFYPNRSKDLKSGQLTQIQQIMQSYKINESPKPSTRMKWRISSNQGSKQFQKQKNKSVENSNIEMLNQTIPQMENRIKLLSLNRNSTQLKKQPYRTLQSRSYQLRHYIPRLF